MHHGYTIAGTGTAASAALVAQVETVRAPEGMPWWVPLACAAVGIVPSVLAFVSERLKERTRRAEVARFDATVAKLTPPTVEILEPS
jgi:hypothetical protein